MFAWFRRVFAGAPAEPAAEDSSGMYTFSRACGQCRKTLVKYQGGFGGMTSQSEGVNCPKCRKTWCNGCHAPSLGQQCQKCGGQLQCNFG